MGPGSRRELLIAVNAAPLLSRAAVCRLGAEIDCWAEGPDRDPGRLAAELGIPRPQMERALALAAPGAAAGLARREIARAGELGARILTRADPGYPSSLLDLPLPPPALYVRGELPDGPAVAIVGSRRADPYGLEVADLFSRALAAAGLAVVSGFARGVDAAAHRGALASGRTVAVLGCGLGVDYPRGHRRLGDEIAGSGAVVSELPCGDPPHARHFPVRNRIIAALAGGTLVVQATARSGSLVTARHALELGREVFAVPGRIFDERSIGPNSLIRDGATPVQHPREILDVLAPEAARQERRPPATEAKEEVAQPAPGPTAAVLAALPRGVHRPAEEIAALTRLPIERALGALLELELAGLVRRYPGPLYGRMP